MITYVHYHTYFVFFIKFILISLVKKQLIIMEKII